MSVTALVSYFPNRIKEKLGAIHYGNKFSGKTLETHFLTIAFQSKSFKLKTMEKSTVETPKTKKRVWTTPDLELICREVINGKNYSSYPENYVIFPGFTGSAN